MGGSCFVGSDAITINTVNIETSFHRTSTETEEDMLGMAIPNMRGSYKVHRREQHKTACSTGHKLGLE